MNRTCAMAQLYADAFAWAPSLAEDLRAGHRFNAARAAAQAGCGHGADATGLGEAEAKKWRDLARQWLRAELAARVRASDTDPPGALLDLREAVTRGQKEPDLACVRDPDELDAAVERASVFGSVLVERFVPGRELTVGVLGEDALAVGEIAVDPDSAFSYGDKYQPGAVAETFPADLPAEVAAEARAAALTAHRALRLSGYSRTDFRLDRDGVLWTIEVN